MAKDNTFLDITGLYPFLKNHAQQWSRIETLCARGTQFLGSSLALLGGAMTWVSTPKLVAAISEACGFGVLASGAMPPEALAQAIQDTRSYTKQPFGVNLILLHPQLEQLLEVCQDHQVSHVVFAGGMPQKNHLKAVQGYGGKTLAFIPSLALGKRLLKMGVDAFILEGSEAGGHIGPVSTSVLAQEMLPLTKDVPVFIAGGLGHGEMIMRYLEMGFCGYQIGTYFVTATESPAHAAFKEAFVRAAARDAIMSPQLDKRFPVIPVRALKNRGMERFLDKQREVIERFDQGEMTLEEGQLEIEHFWAGALRRAVCEGDIENGSLMAGQSVGLIKREASLQELIADLLIQMTNAASHTSENDENLMPSLMRATSS